MGLRAADAVVVWWEGVGVSWGFEGGREGMRGEGKSEGRLTVCECCGEGYIWDFEVEG
jgi:hypothetical protein